ncbi:MAG TPA: effector-associated domain EAD1-containing protein, partial [Isosphaeraceae bacterium]
MSTPSIPQRLHEILRDTFIPSELARLVHWKLKEWLHNIARPAGTHDEQVADLIDWAVRQGRLDELIRQAAAERAQRRDMQDLLADWDALAPATVGGPGNVGTSYRGSSPVASRAAGAGAGPLVQSLSPPAGVSRVAFLADHFDDIRKQTIPGAARDTLRREVSQELKDVAAAEGEELGGWCLHAQPGVRLAAVLRLEREPQPNFLQWLGERVAVEEPYIGLRAAAA